MKVYSFLITILFLPASLAIISGCKYEVAQPPWDKQYVGNIGTVTITSIDPSEATPGWNYITIHGTNFTGAIDTTVVHDVVKNKDTTIIYKGIYFDNVLAEVVEFSSTSIKVRRPNMVTDTCRVKVISNKDLLEEKYSPYKIDAVKERYGSFVANVPLSTVTLDNGGNLYVVESTNRYLWKVTPDGQTTQVMSGDTAMRLIYAPSDLKISPDGKLYYLQSTFPRTKEIHMVDLTPTVKKDSTWYSFTPVKNVICGDFDANGYFYTGGRKSGIMIIRPDRSKRDDGYYAADTIVSMRVFNNYVYVATRTGFWRHSISDTSHVGSPEQVLDFSSTAFASLPISAFSFSADGSKMYIGTNSVNPILIADLSTVPIPPSSVDILYKGILPTYCKQLCFGNNGGTNGFYIISGNVTPAIEWTVYRIDVGTTGAPYY